MTVKQLIAELQAIPGDYEVQVILGIMGKDPTIDIEAVSAYMLRAYANHECKLAYFFGTALPKPPNKVVKLHGLS